MLIELQAHHYADNPQAMNEVTDEDFDREAIERQFEAEAAAEAAAETATHLPDDFETVT